MGLHHHHHPSPAPASLAGTTLSFSKLHIVVHSSISFKLSYTFQSSNLFKTANLILITLCFKPLYCFLLPWMKTNLLMWLNVSHMVWSLYSFTFASHIVVFFFCSTATVEFVRPSIFQYPFMTNTVSNSCCFYSPFFTYLAPI